MLLTYSNRDISKKSLRIDLFDFFKLENKIKICYNIKEYKIKKENKMNKLYNNLTIDNLVKTEWINQFNKKQKEEILGGLEDNLDVSIYANKEFDFLQMREIRIRLMLNLNAFLYANPKFNVYQMNLLLTALSKNLDISYCLNEKLDRTQMKQIIKGLENNVDVSIYAKPEIPWQEMEEIRLELLKRKNKEG